MQIQISTRHGHLGAATKERISTKLEKLGRYYDRLTAIFVTVDLEKEDAPEVEIRVTAERAADFVATESGSNLMSVVDATMHKLEQQVRRHKEKVIDHRQGRKSGDKPLSERGDDLSAPTS